MRRRLIALAFIGYLVVVTVGVFGPAPGGLLDRVGRGLRYGGRGALAVLTGHPAAGSRAGEFLQGVWPFGEIGFENLANVVLFVPLALAFPLLWPRWRWWTVVAGIGLSVSIELAQGVFLPWRTPSVDDVVSNSLGAVIGFSLWLVVRRLWGRWGDVRSGGGDRRVQGRGGPDPASGPAVA